jgi:hypothetical protein
MQPTSEQKLTIELQIEELEDRIAPDGGETVLPLCGGSGGRGEAGSAFGSYGR